MANLNDPRYDDNRDTPGFTVRRGGLSLPLPPGRGRAGGGPGGPPEHSDAHQLVNRGEETVRFLAISTSGAPDVVMYPDSGKLGAFERLPRGGGLYELFRRSDAVDYMEGETPPG